MGTGPKNLFWKGKLYATVASLGVTDEKLALIVVREVLRKYVVPRARKSAPTSTLLGIRLTYSFEVVLGMLYTLCMLN